MLNYDQVPLIQEVVKAAASGSLVGGATAAGGRGNSQSASLIAVTEAMKLLPGETVLDFRSDKAPKVA